MVARCVEAEVAAEVSHPAGAHHEVAVDSQRVEEAVVEAGLARAAEVEASAGVVRLEEDREVVASAGVHEHL